MRKMKDSGIEWIGDIPEGWEVNRLKSHIYVKDKKEKYLNQKYIGLENVESWTGKYRESALTPEGLCNVFEKNDILFGKLRPYLAKCIVADFDGLCSTEFIVICSYGGCNKYFKYVLLSQPVIEEITSETYGTKMPRANWEKIGNITLVIPPLSEQQRIADYLDARCARIDETAELVRQSMEKLRAYKLSLITEAVTKGLDPDVPMKDSGIPWIGEVPEGWEVMRLKHTLSSPLQYGANASGISYDSTLPRYIRITDIDENGCLKDENMQSLPEDEALGYILDDGDILLARSGATVGKSFLYKKELGRAAFAGYLIRAKMDISILLYYYFYYITQSQMYRGWKDYIFVQATIQNIGAEKYSNLYIPLPPLSEQQRIADYLDAKCARIDALLEEKERLLDRLAEYKKSLIFECVTGKREVSA